MRPVSFEANRLDWDRLAGDWQGEYWMQAYDRHGVVSFRLVAEPQAASGDVLMIPDRSGAPYQRHGPDPMIRDANDRTALLTIRFVQAEHDDIAGRIEPYWDPDRRCDAVATFRGAVDGDRVHGTVSSICVGESWRVLNGQWRAERKRPITR
jgi:hypothetical protein